MSTPPELLADLERVLRIMRSAHGSRNRLMCVWDTDVAAVFNAVEAIRTQCAPQPSGEQTAQCTLCSSEPSSGFYTGCMVKDGHAPEWECDGKGNLTRTVSCAAREALEAARQEIVLAIAFLGRDSRTDRLQSTVDGLIKRLVEADKAAIAALSLPAAGGEASKREADLREALTLARARVAYLGAACPNPKHYEANETHFLPIIDAALLVVPEQRGSGGQRS